MTGSLVDFHCHLDLYQDFLDVLADTERSKVLTLAVTTTPRAWPRNRELTQDLRYVSPALGFHPQLVGENTKQELALWDKYFPDARYIGEVGLDGGPDFRHTLDQQRLVFQHVLNACADVGGKVISVHSVRSVKTVLGMIEASLPSHRGRVVMHWFTGTPSQARRAVDLGCYFSVNIPMLYSERGRVLVKTLPSDRLITETDGPFAVVNGQACRPPDVARGIELLSRLLGQTSEATSARIVANLSSLLGN
jgi:TatD DNase family protein